MTSPIAIGFLVLASILLGAMLPAIGFLYGVLRNLSKTLKYEVRPTIKQLRLFTQEIRDEGILKQLVGSTPKHSGGLNLESIGTAAGAALIPAVRSFMQTWHKHQEAKANQASASQHADKDSKSSESAFSQKPPPSPGLIIPASSAEKPSPEGEKINRKSQSVHLIAH